MADHYSPALSPKILAKIQELSAKADALQRQLDREHASAPSPRAVQAALEAGAKQLARQRTRRQVRQLQSETEALAKTITKIARHITDADRG